MEQRGDFYNHIDFIAVEAWNNILIASIMPENSEISTGIERTFMTFSSPFSPLFVHSPSFKINTLRHERDERFSVIGVDEVKIFIQSLHCFFYDTPQII